MTAWEGMRIALRALRANALRSALTMLGIVIGVAAVITMVAIASGARSAIEAEIRALGANLLLVLPGTATAGGARLGVGSRPTLTEDDALAIAREVPGVVVAAPAISGEGQVVRGNRNWATLIGGTVPGYLIARDWPVERGRAFTVRETAAAKVALLGVTVARELFGAEDPLERTVRIDGAPFTVVGVLGAKGQTGTAGHDQDDLVMIPLSSARLRVLGGGPGAHRRAVDFIMVKAAEAGAMAGIQEEVRALLRQRHRLRPEAEDDFELRDPAEALAAQAEAARALGLLLAAVAAVSLVVGGISIMNIMLVSVTERTREIGVRLAAGPRRRDVRRQFLIEAVVLCALGGLAGVALGAGAAAAIGIGFGLYPAHRAASLDPIEALRFE